MSPVDLYPQILIFSDIAMASIGRVYINKYFRQVTLPFQLSCEMESHQLFIKLALIPSNPLLYLIAAESDYNKIKYNY